jgi:Do/DeqQ family serine protease
MLASDPKRVDRRGSRNPRRLGTALLLAGSLLAYGAMGALPATVGDTPLPSLAPMLERVGPTVVNISTRTRIRHEDHPLLRDPVFRWFFDLPEQEQREDSSLGSGVIVDAQRGYVLTNHHVIDKAHEIRVTLQDGRRLEARLVGSDPEIDVALLQIPAKELHAITLGDSERLRVGDFVVAIGSPFGLSHTVTSGIVSALGRSGLGIEGYESFIQTDASINPGNSGGPLVNLRGELVGINTAILAPSGGNIGISFAIPVHMVRAVMEQLIEYGEVRRGRFGAEAQDLSPELAEALGLDQRQGALLLRVAPGSPAEAGGLRDGDVVVGLNDKPIRSAADLRNRLGLLRIGAAARLEVMRDRAPVRVSVTMGDPLAGFVHGEHIHDYLRGAMLGEIIDSSTLGRLPAIAVGHVERDSNAWNLGLRKADVIIEVNRARTKNLAALAAALRQAQRGISLRVRRGDRLLRLLSR